jgi:lysophospholipase L1-like esterase
MVLSVLAVLSFLGAQGSGFKDGENVCFLGDSITHSGHFHRFLYDYYLTRFPDATIRFVNAGIAGDSAGGAQGRLVEDVISKRPTSVVVMFGMNDVNRGSYVADPDAQQQAAQAGALASYRKNMEALVARIREEAGEPHILFVTPTPFDQTVVNDGNNNQPGCNDGLAKCAELVKELAVTNNGYLVDFHAPMTEFNLDRQKTEPTYTIIGPDRVHPGAAGHLMMAYLFLKAQDAPALVSRVILDSASGWVKESANATVTHAGKKDGAWEFTVLERALPFPIDEVARAELKRLPIERELNQQILAVTSLAAGNYELTIDGLSVGKYAAGELAKGVNLAFNAATPQYQQAKAVAKLNEVRHSTEGILRNYAAVRWFLKLCQVNPDDVGAVQEFAATKMNKTGYFEGMVPGYLVEWPKRNDLVARVKELEKQIFAARRPVAHVYRVQAVQ